MIPRKTFFATKKEVTSEYQRQMRDPTLNDSALNVNQANIKYKYHRELLEVGLKTGTDRANGSIYPRENTIIVVEEPSHYHLISQKLVSSLHQESTKDCPA